MSDALVKRIEALNKKPLEHVPPKRDPDPDIEAARRKIRNVSGEGFPETTEAALHPAMAWIRPTDGPNQHWLNSVQNPARLSPSKRS